MTFWGRAGIVAKSSSAGSHRPHRPTAPRQSKGFIAAKKLVDGQRTLRSLILLPIPASKPAQGSSLCDFKEFKNAIDLLVKAAGMRRKIYSEGSAADRAQTIAEMRTKLKTFPQQLLPYERNWLQEKAQQPKKFVAGLTAIPTILRRWERYDPRGSSAGISPTRCAKRITLIVVFSGKYPGP